MPFPPPGPQSKEDVEGILTLFKAYVAKNRPSLDIDKVATGETWFGDDAVELGLCDELKTKDDVIIEYIKGGFECYEIEYDESEGIGGGGLGGLPFGRKVREFVGGIVGEAVREELGIGGVEEKYMIRDEVKDRIRFE